MNNALSEHAQRQLSVSPPQQSPLDIPAGGAAVQTPYPQFDVASWDKWALDWDEKTRRLVIERVRNVPAYRFFSDQEVELLEALCARVLPQDDRSPEARMPMAPWIDQRLYH